MAPELFYEEHYNEKVDIYGFGLILLELATMEFPYRECKNTGEVMEQLEKVSRSWSLDAGTARRAARSAA